MPIVDETQQCGRAAFEVQHLTAARVCIAISGDVDATNRQALGRFVDATPALLNKSILDLSRVDFFGSQGFTALFTSASSVRDETWTG